MYNIIEEILYCENKERQIELLNQYKEQFNSTDLIFIIVNQNLDDQVKEKAFDIWIENNIFSQSDIIKIIHSDNVDDELAEKAHNFL